MQVIAHRGYSAAAPENTIAAFQKALDAGCYAVEFDIQETSDSVPIVLHDYSLSRLARRDGHAVGQNARDVPASALQDVEVGGWFGPEFRGEPIPTLDAAAEFLSGRAQAIYPELKAGLREKTLTAFMDTLHLHSLERIATVISFDWWALQVVRRINPKQRIGFLVGTEDEFEGAVLRAQEAGNAIVDCHWGLLHRHPAQIELARQHGVDLAVYTVDDPSVARTLVQWGVRGITTNEVERVQRALQVLE